MKSEKQLMSKNDASIEEVTEVLEGGLEILNKINQEFMKFEIGTLKTKDLPSLERGEEFLKQWLTKDTSNVVGSIKVNKKMLGNMVELPQNTGAFVDACGELVDYLRQNRGWIPIYKYYEVDKNNTVILMQSNVDAVLEQYYYYAESKKEIEFFEIAKKLCEVGNEVGKWNQKYNIFGTSPVINTDVVMFLTYSYSMKKYIIDGKIIKSKAANYK